VRADEPSFVQLARVLAAHGVEYVLVGGLAAVLHGAPIVTKDADILHRRTPDNVTRLLAALHELRAVYRGDDRDLTPGPPHLLGSGHHLLRTALGDLDVLGAIGRGTTYDDVIGDAVAFELESVTLHVIDLRRLIESKEQAGRAKDHAALPVLRATLAEIERGSRG
jgi:hypothetical protein